MSNKKGIGQTQLTQRNFKFVSHLWTMFRQTTRKEFNSKFFGYKPSCINGGLIVGILAIPGGMGFTLGGCDVAGPSGGRIKCAAGSVIGGCMVGGPG